VYLVFANTRFDEANTSHGHRLASAHDASPLRLCSLLSLAEARDLYAASVKAGERALGEELFTEAVGHFWELMERRPFT